MKVKDTSRFLKKISIISLVFATFGMTIAFAVLSNSLNINGKVNARPVWDVHIDDVWFDVTSTAKKGNDPKITAYTVENFEVMLSKPGDVGIFYINIKNSGNIDAIIDDITLSNNLTYQGTPEDIGIVKEYFRSEVGFVNKEYGFGSPINSGDTITIYVKFWYDEDANELPEKPVIIKDCNLNLYYVQKTVYRQECKQVKKTT